MCEWAVKEVGFDGGLRLTRWNDVDSCAVLDPEAVAVVDVDEDEKVASGVDGAGSCDDESIVVLLS